MPTWEARYEEITNVAAVGRVPVMTHGVRFRTVDGEWVVFWAINRGKVLRTLAARGLAVAPKPVRFHFLDPGR